LIYFIQNALDNSYKGINLFDVVRMLIEEIEKDDLKSLGY